MGERTSYRPGTFCWADLATTDVDGAVAFYGRLLGWRPEPVPAGEGMTYVMMRRGEGRVAGIYAMDDDRRALGAPPAWMSYVSVEDADATARRALQLGGTAVVAPVDVLDAGRMALLQDPQGAMVGIWQPREMIGATLVNDPGAMCLNQLTTTDPEAAAEFYEGLFGWEFPQVSTEPPFWSIHNEGALNGGLMGRPPGSEAPPHWLVYFTTTDLDAAAATIAAREGQVVAPPMAVPAGRFLVARDRQGAHFALFEGRVDP